jgi:hypothetical protein
MQPCACAHASVCLCVCVCVFACVYVHVCMNARACECVCVCLHVYVCVCACLSVFRRFLQPNRPTSVPVVMAFQGTPMHHAAGLGRCGMTEVLTLAGASVDAKDRVCAQPCGLGTHTELPVWPQRDATPLHLAACGGHDSTIVALIDAGAAVDATDMVWASACACARPRGAELSTWHAARTRTGRFDSVAWGRQKWSGKHSVDSFACGGRRRRNEQGASAAPPSRILQTLDVAYVCAAALTRHVFDCRMR